MENSPIKTTSNSTRVGESKAFYPLSVQQQRTPPPPPKKRGGTVPTAHSAKKLKHHGSPSMKPRGVLEPRALDFTPAAEQPVALAPKDDDDDFDPYPMIPLVPEAEFYISEAFGLGPFGSFFSAAE